MAETETLTHTGEETAAEAPWNVVLHDDPVNLPNYVTLVLMKIFGYNEKKASVLMQQAHRHGRSIVWSGDREKAEFYTQQLQVHQLRSSLEKSG